MLEFFYVFSGGFERTVFYATLAGCSIAFGTGIFGNVVRNIVKRALP